MVRRVGSRDVSAEQADLDASSASRGADAPRAHPRAPGSLATGAPPELIRGVVGYLRRSTDRQEQSIGDQRAAVERHAAERGLVVSRWYTDDAVSGTSTAGRRAFQALIADASSGAFREVLVYDVKRFGRVDNDEAGYYRHLLRTHGVVVTYVSENFSGDGTDDLLRPVKQWQAREESKDLARVTIRGLVSKATAVSPCAGAAHGDEPTPASAQGPSRDVARAGGWWMGGSPPFGYDLRYESARGAFLVRVRYARDGSKEALDDQGRLLRRLERGESLAVTRKDRCKLVPGEAKRVKIVRRIFRMYAEQGLGFKAIAARLNAEGIETARGEAWGPRCSGRWSASAVRAMLVNPAYRGDMAWNRRTDARFFRISQGRAVERGGRSLGRRLEANPERDWIVIANAHEGLVARALWNAAQRRLQCRAKAQPPSAPGSAPRGARGASGGSGGSGAGAGGGVRVARGAGVHYLLSGLCSCAGCGNRYEGYTQRSRSGGASKRTYACGAAIRQGVCRLGQVDLDVLEQTVLEAVGGHYARYRGAKGLNALEREALGDARARASERKGERARAQQRLAAVEALLRRLIDSATPKTRDILEERMVELDAERRGLRETLATLEMPGAGVMKRRLEVAKRFVEGLDGALRGEDRRAARDALRGCVRGIVVDKEGARLALTLACAPGSLGAGAEGGPGGENATVRVVAELRGS